MKRGFSKHPASKEHLRVPGKKKSNGMNWVRKLSHWSTEAIERNCCYSSNLIDIVAFLATHQLAFRGKNDVFESKDKREDGLLKFV